MALFAAVVVSMLSASCAIVDVGGYCDLSPAQQMDVPAGVSVIVQVRVIIELPRQSDVVEANKRLIGAPSHGTSPF